MGKYIDSTTYTSMLQGCIDEKFLSEGKLVHANIIQRGFEWQDMVLENSLLTMYAKCGNVDDAQNVFEKNAFTKCGIMDCDDCSLCQGWKYQKSVITILSNETDGCPTQSFHICESSSDMPQLGRYQEHSWRDNQKGFSVQCVCRKWAYRYVYKMWECINCA